MLLNPVRERNPKGLPKIKFVYVVLEITNNPEKNNGNQYNVKGIYETQEEANTKVLELQDTFAGLMRYHLKDDLFFYGTDDSGGAWWDMEFVDSRTMRMQVEAWL